MSAISHLLLERANASVKTGARQTQVFGILFGLGVIAYLLWRRPPLAGLLVILVAVLGFVLIVYARRLRTLAFTAVGIDGLGLNPPMRWDTIVKASYSNRAIALHDQFGRVAQVKLIFLTSPSAVMKAIAYHLPPGVTMNWFFSGQPVDMGELPEQVERR